MNKKMTNEKEDYQWLDNYDSNNRPSIQYILKHSNILFYPGSYFDFDPINVFNKKEFCDLYIYCDYSANRGHLFKNMEYKGYCIEDIIEVSSRYLFKNGYEEEFMKPYYNGKYDILKNCIVKPYQYLIIYKKDNDDVEGLNRFALLYIARDAYPCYYNLFKNEEIKKNLKVLILQDHGFGLNYDIFGRGGLLNNIAINYSITPQYLYVAIDNTKIWNGYEEMINESYYTQRGVNRILCKKRCKSKNL